MARNLLLVVSMLFVLAPGISEAKKIRKIASTDGCMTEYDICGMNCAKLVPSCYQDGEGCQSKKIIKCIKNTCADADRKTCTNTAANNNNLESVEAPKMSSAARLKLNEAVTTYLADGDKNFAD